MVEPVLGGRFFATNLATSYPERGMMMTDGFLLKLQQPGYKSTRKQRRNSKILQKGSSMQSFDKNQRFVGNLRVSMVSVVVTFCDDSGYGKFDYGYTICTIVHVPF